MTKRCPTPHKQAHTSRTAAFAHMVALRKKGPTLDEVPYKCQCGAWHVGNRRAGRRKPKVRR